MHRRTRIDRPRRGGGGRRGGRAALSLSLLGALVACDSLLEVENPGAVEAEDLENPALANTIVNSALGQFECALTSYVVSTGLLADELINASGWLNINGWGWRGVELEEITGACPTTRDATGLGAFTPLQQADYLTTDGVRLIESFPAEEVVGDKTDMLARLTAYGGYARLLLGEGFCEMALAQGPLLQPPEVLRMAVERFTEAIEYARTSGNTDIELLATLGRARALLDLDDLEGAYADAALIPPGWSWTADYSSVDPVRENRLYNLNRFNNYVSANPDEYGDLTVGGVADPRVVIEFSGGAGHDGETPHWYQSKYLSPEDDITIASWEEARLIMAEARPAEAATHLAALREAQGLPSADVTGLSGSEAEVLAVVLEERRRQLWLEGHRLNDMLRHGLEFPQGLNHKGQPYGPVTCMPLPDQERRSNPNIPS